MSTLAEIAAELDRLGAALNVPGGVDAELTLQTADTRTIGWGEGKPILNNAASSTGACVRVIAGGGQGVATTTVPEAETIRSLTSRALEAARSTGADRHRALASPAPKYPAAVPADAASFSRPSDEILEQLRGLEASALASDSRLTKVVRMSYSESRFHHGIVSTRGVKAASEGTVFGFSLELLASDGNHTEAAWDYEGHRLGKNLSLEKIVKQTAENAVRSLGGAPLPTGKYPVVLHPRVASQLLDLVGEALSAEAVQLGRSFLKGLLGKRVAAEAVTIVDDPFLADGVASAPFDDEGVPHEKIRVVENGVLSSYLYDLRSAARDGRASNGHGEKEGLGAPPRPAPTNLFIKSGDAKPAEMLAAGPKVFQLREVMGLHMADPITGEFSLGASGLLYEKGAFSRPVRGVTISGTIAGLLNAIEAVGNDLRFYGRTGSPSLLAGGLTLAGN